MAKNNTKDKVSIIVLAVNSLDLIKNELKEISKLDTKVIKAECIIVDNGSNDGLQEYIKDYKLPNMGFKYLKNTSNLGFAEGNNVGINYALNNGSKYILLLNNDMILSNDLLIKLAKFLNDNPKIGLVSPKIYFAKGYEFHKDRYHDKDLGNVIWYAGGNIDWNNIYTSHIGVDEIDSGQYDKIIKTEIANGACVLIRKEVFEKIGLLDRGLFLYWEDADFCQRALRNGFGIMYYPGTTVWHKVSSSAGGSGSISNDYFLIRNRLYFALRYAGLRARFAVLRDTVKLAINGREWQKIGARDALLGKKGIGSWAKK
ncbi:MAG: hypothetical protein ACD_26C00034G0089 [uncultured bacterium]|nr:MAG: hypothetical protein ACD_26C00034G0089 [uncultured bacterium]